MEEQIRLIFRTVGHILFSEVGLGLFMILFTISIISIFVDYLKRAFYSRSSELTKEQKEESDYFDTDSYIDPWEIPDKKF